MLNPLIARFSGIPAFVNEGSSVLFESCLQQVAQHERAFEMLNEGMQADDGFWPAADDWRAVYRPYNVRDGVLLIPVKGVLLHEFPFALGNWATGYEYIWRAFKRGMADEGVKGIAFICNTPGGMVAGCFDAGDKMFAMRGQKPIRAFAQESAYSAGYAIASVADHINVSATGGVGSIGVVTMHVDMSKALDDAGFKITFIQYGKHKTDGNPYESLSKEAKARIQARIDELGEIFVTKMARNRGLDEQVIRDFEALTFTASEATSNGLADSVGSLDDAVAAFAADCSLDDGDDEMTDKTTGVDQATHDAAVANARTEGHAAGLKEGATAATTRISAILALDESKSRHASALNIALTTDLSVEQAKGLLGTLPEEKAAALAAAPAAGGKTETPFEKAMNTGDNPNLGAGHKEETADTTDDQSAAILGDYRAAVGTPKKSAA